MSNWRKILWPLVPLYALATGIRNRLFDLGILASQSFQTPVVVIGNLSTGGSGKTPMAEFLLYKISEHNPGFVSRGYGRHTSGLRIISANDSALDIGDEPWQIMQKFPNLNAAVSERRSAGIQALIDSANPGVIVLDDAFQHRSVKGDFNILLTTWKQPYFHDHLLPAGNLRESRGARGRADVIVVTKCPASLNREASQDFRKKLKAGNKPVFFSTVEYGRPLNSKDLELAADGRRVNLITGIANAKDLVEMLNSEFELVKHWHFGDHHHFSEEEILAFESSEYDIITTEKDWSRLKGRVSDNLAGRLYRWPIRMKILFDEEQQFLNEIQKAFSAKEA